MSETKQTKREGFLTATQGAAMSEYIVLVGVVGLVLAAALVTRGKATLSDYTNARDLVLLPAQ